MQNQNIEPEILRGSSPPSSLRASDVLPWTPESLQAKLQDRLEAGFNKHFQPADKCPSNRLYLAIILRTHFRLEHKVAQELADHTTTIRELLDQLTALLCPNANLFTATPTT